MSTKPDNSTSCLTLLRLPDATLTGVPELLSSPRFRRRYLDGLDNPVGLGGFWTWYEQLFEPSKPASSTGDRPVADVRRAAVAALRT